MVTMAATRTCFRSALIMIAIGSAPVAAAASNAAGSAGGRPPAPLEIRKPAAPQPWQRYKVDSQDSIWPQADWSAYNTLAKTATLPSDGSLHYMTPNEGDPASGRQFAFDRARGGSCVAWHAMCSARTRRRNLAM